MSARDEEIAGDDEFVLLQAHGPVCTEFAQRSFERFALRGVYDERRIGGADGGKEEHGQDHGKTFSGGS